MSKEEATLGNALAKLTGSASKTPTDVAMQTLDIESAWATTEIRNVKMMNMLKLVIAYYTGKVAVDEGDKQKWSLPLSFFETLYDANIQHMVPYKRQRIKELVKLFAPIMAMFGMDPNADKKGGLFGGKNK